LVDRLTTLFGGGDVDISVEIDPRSFSLEWALTLAIAQCKSPDQFRRAKFRS
jgi:hypothetical protein